MNRRILCTQAATLVLVAANLAACQSHFWSFGSSNVVVPQCRAYAMGPAVQIVRVGVRANIVERMATTVLEVGLFNPTASRLEAQLLLPTPTNAVVRGFDFAGGAARPTARLLPKAEAEQTYRSLVAKARDPALLEFAGHSFVQSSVFPVEPGAPQTIRLVYETLLHVDNNRIDYVLPRSESLDYRVPWTVEAHVQSKTPIATIYSPSHPIETVWQSATATAAGGEHVQAPAQAARNATVRVAPSAAHQPGPFRLSILAQHDGIAATLVAAPDPKSGGGYFLLLAGAPPMPSSQAATLQKREVTLVIDRSGSMHGEKMDQVREAGLQVLAGLREGESFNIIDYQTGVDHFAPQPVVKSRDVERGARDYLKALLPGGGTNIHEALATALNAPPTAAALPIVLFLTDGLPTVGQTSEVAIRDLLKQGNPHRRRVFTFGVGVDVNTPLLEAIAQESRAAATFVLPKENVEVKVADLFKRLAGPILTDPSYRVVRADGTPALGRVQDVMPERLPDLFDGDQLVLLGRYVGTEPVELRLRGNFLGAHKEFTYRFDPAVASSANAFVPRLWASRRIAQLVDAIRRMGADSAPAVAAPNSVPQGAADPRFKELVDEIVRLSTEFGVLTEYTAFLALEGTDLTRRGELQRCAVDLFEKRAMQCRSGWASVNQSLNNVAQRGQKELKPRNDYLDHEMKAVEISSVQQIHDKCFFRKGNRWVDSAVIAREGAPSRTIEFGSDEFFGLVKQLAAQGRSGALTLRGDILLELEGKAILIRAPKAANP